MKNLFFILVFTAPSLIKAQQNIHFIPTSFSNKFSANIPPVLGIRGGDTIRTETVDASGTDKNGLKKARGGNPLTGPFYVENASPGDMLAITFIRVSLNRSYAFTTENFVPRSLHNFKIPLNPFLGCVGVAPSNNKHEILSFFQGSFGGNLDFSAVRQSSTIYLPVFHKGAYLFLGDGHAEQGDGELAGNALETSMNVDFTVRVIKAPGYALSFPRIEDSVSFMAMGVDKSLDGALRLATKNLLDWLQTEYKISLPEATQVISTSIVYSIAEIADPDVEIVATIKKERLKQLK